LVYQIIQVWVLNFVWQQITPCVQLYNLTSLQRDYVKRSGSQRWPNSADWSISPMPTILN